MKFLDHSRLVRTGAFFCLTGALILAAGCSKKNAETSESNANAELKTPLSQDGETESRGTATLLLAKNLSELMELAERQNSESQYEAAYQTWREIHRRVTDEFGLDAWQTVSAELAMNAARQRTALSSEDQELSSELTQLNASAINLIDQQKFQEARAAIEKAAGISTRLWGKESYVTANVNYIRAQCYFGLGENDRALAVLSDVLKLRIALTGENHPDVESTLEMFYRAHSLLKHTEAALTVLKKLASVSGELWGLESEVYAKRLNDLGVAYNNSGKPLLALEKFEELIRIRKKLHGEQSIQEGHARLNKGLALAKAQQFDSAQTEMKAAYDLFHKQGVSKKDPIWALLLDQLGKISLIEKEYLQGQKYFSELVDRSREIHGETHLDYGKSLFKLGVSIGNQGKYKEAQPIMKRAIAIFESNLGPDNKQLHQPLTTYAQLLEKLGGNDEAERIKDRAVRLTGFQDLPR